MIHLLHWSTLCPCLHIYIISVISNIDILFYNLNSSIHFVFRSTFFPKTVNSVDFWTSSSSSYSWRVRHVSCSLILKMKLVPPSLPRLSYVPSSFMLVLVFCLCPSSIRVVATFSGTVFFLYYVLCPSFFPNFWTVYNNFSVLCPAFCY
jgi:hypothetical protein